MSHDHAHRDINGRALGRAMALSGGYMIVELAAGLWTGSLALLADAGHMLTDVGGLGLALLAVRFARRPPTPSRTYGYYRAEILAAVVNAVVLLGISAWVLVEAYHRWRQPGPIDSGVMLAVAVVGLLVNASSLLVLQRAEHVSLNMRGAYFEVLSDLVTSAGVIAAALAIRATGWTAIDPLVSAGIALFIVPRTWLLLKEAVGVLLEGTPEDVDVDALREALSGIDGVSGVHDLHVWALTSGVNALSVHVVTASAEHGSLLTAIGALMRRRFGIEHTTVQIEPPDWPCPESHV